MLSEQRCIVCQDSPPGSGRSSNTHAPPKWLGREARLHHFRRKEYVFRAGSEATAVWTVCRGTLKLCRHTVEGKLLTTRIVGPGDIVGHRSVLSHESYTASAIALQDSDARALPAAVFRRMIAESEEIREQVLEQLGIDLRRAEYLAGIMAHASARVRVAAMLHELHERRDRGAPMPGMEANDHDDLSEGEFTGDGAGGEDPWNEEIPRRELAELAGLTVEATVRAVKALEKDGIVLSKGRTIRIVSPEALHDEF